MNPDFCNRAMLVILHCSRYLTMPCLDFLVAFVSVSFPNRACVAHSFCLLSRVNGPRHSCIPVWMGVLTTSKHIRMYIVHINIIKSTPWLTLHRVSISPRIVRLKWARVIMQIIEPPKISTEADNRFLFLRSKTDFWTSYLPGLCYYYIETLPLGILKSKLHQTIICPSIY